MAWRGWIIAVAAAFSLDAGVASPQSAPPVSDFKSLEGRMGQDVVACGSVAGTRTDSNGSLLLDLDRPAPNQAGTIRIPKPVAFGADIEHRILLLRVCVKGTVERFDNRIAVRVEDNVQSLWSDPVEVRRPDGFAAGVRELATTTGVSGLRLIGVPVRVAYPEAAIRAKRDGIVEAEIVVRTDGSVGQIRLARSADGLWGLDDAVLNAARLLRFEPAVADGQAVEVVTRLHAAFAKEKAASLVAFEGFGLQPAPEGTVNQLRVTGLKLIEGPKPKYTPDAMRAKIQGTVQMEAVVQRDGTVRVVRVVHSIDPFGLDYAAIECAQRWRFEPGRVDGQPVDTRIFLDLEFRLH